MHRVKYFSIESASQQSVIARNDRMILAFAVNTGRAELLVIIRGCRMGKLEDAKNTFSG
jgi:hypothetical protein